jgi:hypothetical protein
MRSSLFVPWTTEMHDDVQENDIQCNDIQ